jgi:DNA-directed RNA polymerase subunit RPC12/RpoP
MNLNLDSESVAFACPHCGKKINEKIGRLKRDPKITCPSCHGVFDVDANQLRTAIKSAQKSLDDFTRKLRNFGK